jgi:hypothetical protein
MQLPSPAHKHAQYHLLSGSLACCVFLDMQKPAVPSVSRARMTLLLVVGLPLC